jgi:SAM-dependent methyltransferase
MSNVSHLPYQIDPDSNRNHYYETLWKIRALELLTEKAGNQAGKVLLDYGCGRGETMDLAKKQGMTVRGTDMDPECVRLASEYGPCEVLDLADPVAQFGEKAADVVACFHVLEHVPCPVETMNQLRRLSRKHLLLAVPNLRLIPDLLRKDRNVFAINEGHLQSWDHSHFLNLAERHCGMKHLAWTFDHVKIPILSNLICNRLGQKAAVKYETGLFRNLFPYQSNSIIGLFEVVG